MTVCDICGSTAVQEIKCKMICRNCGTILQSCADLANPGSLDRRGDGRPHRP